MTYEYKTVEIAKPATLTETEMNALGAEGFRLVATQDDYDQSPNGRGHFRRWTFVREHPGQSNANTTVEPVRVVLEPEVITSLKEAMKAADKEIAESKMVSPGAKPK